MGILRVRLSGKPSILPSIHNPSGALPARFRRQRVLIVGCGDIGLRAAALLRGRVQVLALTSSPERVSALRAAGVRPLLADLDAPQSLRRLAGLADRVLHLAPPSNVEGARWWRDARTTALVRALRQRVLPTALVYGSTSGVYGDCGGARIDETRRALAGAGRRGDAHPAHPRHLRT
jgi:nucleoside-diphosphate-sugar epimerase